MVKVRIENAGTKLFMMNDSGKNIDAIVDTKIGPSSSTIVHLF
ncbi:MAG: hypothetical protein QXE38_05405 [Candidatus Methanomethylicia archaeon]